MMKTSQNGIDLIKQFEGCRLSAYLDAVGVPTIGYGHITGVKMGDKITQTQAENLLREDLVKYENAVNELLLHYQLNQNEFDALVSFAFNLGTGNLKKLTANNTRNKGQIADAMLQYNKAGGQVLSGLTKRRKKERDLFCTPVSSGATPVIVQKTETVYPTPRVNIKKGSTGIGVKWLQTKLNEKGGYGLKVDGIAGQKTIDALIDYQTKHLLDPDGICGKLTRQSLNA